MRGGRWRKQANINISVKLLAAPRTKILSEPRENPLRYSKKNPNNRTVVVIMTHLYNDTWLVSDIK